MFIKYGTYAEYTCIKCHKTIQIPHAEVDDFEKTGMLEKCASDICLHAWVPIPQIPDFSAD